MTSTTDYGVCRDCEAPMPTQDDANAHMAETMPKGMTPGNSSHTIRVLNPTEQQKTRNAVDWAVEDAIANCVQDLDEQVERGRLTVEDVTAALHAWPDFSDAWAEYVEESA